MTSDQIAGLVAFLVGFVNLYGLVTRYDRWQARLGPAAQSRAARLAVVIYVLVCVVLPMALGLAYIYVLKW